MEKSISQLKEDVSMGKAEIMGAVAAAVLTVSESVSKEVETFKWEQKTEMAQSLENLCKT